MAQNELNFPSRSRTQALGKLYKKITNEDMPAGANTTTEALQKVYEALTEDTKHHTNVTKIIDDLATNWSGGGGGSSDFSTATVTVVDSNTGYISSSRYMIPYITENDGVSTTMVYAENESYDLIVPLYKGKGTFEGISENIVVSGDANYDENTHAVHILGNCSIKGWQ